MKEYDIKYRMTGAKKITLVADSKEDAVEELARIINGEKTVHEENNWIDMWFLLDMEWDYDYPIEDDMEKLRIKITERSGIYTATLQMRYADERWFDSDDFYGRGISRRDAMSNLRQIVRNHIEFLNQNLLDNDDITVVDQNGGRFEDYEL